MGHSEGQNWTGNRSGTSHSGLHLTRHLTVIHDVLRDQIEKRGWIASCVDLSG